MAVRCATPPDSVHYSARLLASTASLGTASAEVEEYRRAAESRLRSVRLRATQNMMASSSQGRLSGSVGPRKLSALSSSTFGRHGSSPDVPSVRLARAHSLSGVSSTASLPALDASLPPSRSSASRIMVRARVWGEGRVSVRVRVGFGEPNTNPNQATRSLYNGITDAKRARARLGTRALTHIHT